MRLGWQNIPGTAGRLSGLLDAEVPVAYIETENDNEVRDLFVRLQSGSPLNSQEKRDTYPGEFTGFILQLGGKPDIPRYPGHEFFQRVLRMKPGRDRGKTRQFAAQVAILFLEQHRAGRFTDINSGAIDDYYHTNLDFDSEAPTCKRLVSILDKLNQLLGVGPKLPLRGHDAIHLVLFLDQIWDDYTKSWESVYKKPKASFRQPWLSQQRPPGKASRMRCGIATAFGPGRIPTVERTSVVVIPIMSGAWLNSWGLSLHWTQSALSTAWSESQFIGETEQRVGGLVAVLTWTWPRLKSII